MAVQYSIQKMVSDGTLSTIALGIQYLQRNDIYMRIAGEETPQSGAPSGYTWSFINNTTLKILPVVPNGVEVVVYRRTDVDAMYNVYSQNAQFDEATIDENNQQLLFIAQEYLEQGIPGAGVESLEYVNTELGVNYYRFKLTDGSYTPVFGIPDGTDVLRADLASTDPGKGYNLVHGAASSVELDALAQVIASSRVDTIANLRLVSPTAVGDVVYVRSAIVTPVGVYGYFGGGYFAAYDNTQANIDDGGVFIGSPHPTLDWQRINFTEYDLRFWGVITDLASFDNAPSITLATNFAKARKVLLHAPVGNIYTSEMVPVYNNMGITGQGAAEQTVFYKTTNNAFPYKANGNTVFTVDALVGFVPKTSIAGGSVVDGETHTARPHLSKCMFRRAGLTAANYATTRPAVGLFAGSMAGGLVSDVTLEGGYIGVQGWTCYLATMERLFVNNYPGKGFTAFTFSAYTAPPAGIRTSGTSLDMRLVNARGYQLGFEMIGQQYTSMTCCTVEECEPMAGETFAVAFRFVNPYSITMDACATEGVKGTQIQVTNAAPISYKASLVVQNYIAIDQRNPVTAGTKFIEIDSGAVGTLNVTFIGGDLTRDVLLSNLVQGVVSGTGSKAIKIGAGGLVLTAASGGLFSDLA